MPSNRFPGKSGTQLAEEMVARNCRTKILLSSGYLMQEGPDADQSLDGIDFPFLRKPYSVRGLRAAVHDALS